jgi:hypothetical protein
MKAEATCLSAHHRSNNNNSSSNNPHRPTQPNLRVKEILAGVEGRRVVAVETLTKAVEVVERVLRVSVMGLGQEQKEQRLGLRPTKKNHGQGKKSTRSQTRTHQSNVDFQVREHLSCISTLNVDVDILHSISIAWILSSRTLGVRDKVGLYPGV